MKKKTLFRIFSTYLTVSFILVVICGVPGCATSLKKGVGSINRGQPSKSELILPMTIDVLTLPIQAVVFGPMLVKEKMRQNEELEEGGVLADELCKNPNLLIEQNLLAGFATVQEAYAVSKFLNETEVVDPSILEYILITGHNNHRKYSFKQIALLHPSCTDETFKIAYERGGRNHFAFNYTAPLFSDPRMTNELLLEMSKERYGVAANRARDEIQRRKITEPVK